MNRKYSSDFGEPLPLYRKICLSRKNRPPHCLSSGTHRLIGLWAAAHIALLFLLVTVVGLPAQAAEKADLEKRISSLEKEGAVIDKESRNALGKVEKSVFRDLDAERKKLEQDIRNWTIDLGYESASDVKFVDVQELNQAIERGLVIAKTNGLDVKRLKKIYELTKKVIREADFEIPGKPRPDRDEKLSTHFRNLFVFAFSQEEALAEARRRHMEFKLGLYKRASVAYIRALNATADPPGECDPNKMRPKKMKVNGGEVTVLGCPDAVVQNLTAYHNAIRTIQSADADALTAEVIKLQAEQQLAADLISVIPYVGEAMDAYFLFAHEDLSGQKITGLQRGLTVFFYMIPYVGKYIPELFEQVIKRSSKAAWAAEKIAWFLRGSFDFAKWVGGMPPALARRLAPELMEKAAKKWNTSVATVKVVYEAMSNIRFEVAELQPALRGMDAERRNLLQSLRDAAQDRVWIMDMPPEIRERAMKEAEETLRANLRAVQPGRGGVVEASGMVSEHVEAFLEVAADPNKPQWLFTRSTNKHARKWLKGKRPAATKHMGIKPKSAEKGPIAGLLPVDQWLNKQGSKLEELMDKHKAGQLAAEEADEIPKLLNGMENGARDVKKCLSDPKCAQAIPFEVEVPPGLGKGDLDLLDNGMVELQAVQNRATGKQEYVLVDRQGRLRDHKTGALRTDIVPEGKPKSVLVLADEEGRYITADYDILNFAEGGRHSQPNFNKDTGYITGSERGTVRELNARVKAKGHTGGNVTHHGGEFRYPGSPGVDYPIIAMGPKGQLIEIPACDANCMARWCQTTGRCDATKVCTWAKRFDGCTLVDPDRLLKDIGHQVRLQGFNYDPNRRWNWGHYNVLGGWRPKKYYKEIELAEKAARTVKDPTTFQKMSQAVQDTVSTAMERWKSSARARARDTAKRAIPRGIRNESGRESSGN